MGRRRASETIDRDALVRRVRNLTSTGMKPKDIARHLKIDADDVGQIVKANPVKPVVAASLIKVGVVGGVLDEEGEPGSFSTRTRSDWFAEKKAGQAQNLARDKRICELFAEGNIITTIAGRMGCSIADVQAALAKAPKKKVKG